MARCLNQTILSFHFSSFVFSFPPTRQCKMLSFQSFPSPPKWPSELLSPSVLNKRSSERRRPTVKWREMKMNEILSERKQTTKCWWTFNECTRALETDSLVWIWKSRMLRWIFFWKRRQASNKFGCWNMSRQSRAGTSIKEQARPMVGSDKLWVRKENKFIN